MNANNLLEEGKKLVLDYDSRIISFEKLSAQRKAAENAMELTLKVLRRSSP